MSYKHVSLEAVLKNYNKEQKTCTKWAVTNMLLRHKIGTNQKYLHLVTQSEGIILLQLHLTPFQNVHHFCQYKIDCGKKLSSLHFEVVV